MDPSAPTIVAADLGISGWQWLVILFIALLFFGHKLPAMMRGLGGSVREFKKGMSTDDAAPPTPPPAAAAPAQPPAAISTPAPPPSAPAAPNPPAK